MDDLGVVCGQPLLEGDRGKSPEILRIDPDVLDFSGAQFFGRILGANMENSSTAKRLLKARLRVIPSDHSQLPGVGRQKVGQRLQGLGPFRVGGIDPIHAAVE